MSEPSRIEPGVTEVYVRVYLEDLDRKDQEMFRFRLDKNRYFYDRILHDAIKACLRSHGLDEKLPITRTPKVGEVLEVNLPYPLKWQIK